MKNFLIYLTTGALLLVLFISGCKKDKQGIAFIAGNRPLAKSTLALSNYGTGVIDSTRTTYSYDDLNRVVKIQVYTSYNAVTSTTTFAYNVNRVAQIDEFGITYLTYNLNSMGFIASDNVLDSFTYDNEGYLVNTFSNGVLAFKNTYNLQHNVYLIENTNSGMGITNDTFYYPRQPFVQPYFGNIWQTGNTTGAIYAEWVLPNGEIPGVFYSSCANDSLGRLSEWKITGLYNGDTIQTTATYYFY